MEIAEIAFISLAFLLVTWSFAIVFLPDELDTLLDFIDETVRKIYRKVHRG
nr:MAG TPA: hypothetical protein [Caudoviricetes sp.]